MGAKSEGQRSAIGSDKVLYLAIMTDRELALRTEDSPAETDLEGTFPALLVRVGKAACFAADEFFRARISNPHTRTAYARQVSRFLAWCEDARLELHQVTPGRGWRGGLAPFDPHLAHPGRKGKEHHGRGTRSLGENPCAGSSLISAGAPAIRFQVTKVWG